MSQAKHDHGGTQMTAKVTHDRHRLLLLVSARVKLVERSAVIPGLWPS